MKQIMILAAALIALAMSGGTQAHIQAQAPVETDSVANAVKLTSLTTRRDALQRRIEAEDAKRNKEIAGVSAETLEAMNDRQDSLCLALRSELLDVVLEIKELTPGVPPARILEQYNTLFNGNDSISASTPKE